MLNLIESLSFLPPQQEEESAKTRSRSPLADRSTSARKAAGSNVAAEKLLASANWSQPAAFCTTPHVTAAEAEAPVGSSAPTRPRDMGAAGGSALPGQLAASRCVEPTGVSISRRAVPVIAWSNDQGSGSADMTPTVHCRPNQAPSPLYFCCGELSLSEHESDLSSPPSASCTALGAHTQLGDPAKGRCAYAPRRIRGAIRSA